MQPDRGATVVAPPGTYLRIRETLSSRLQIGELPPPRLRIWDWSSVARPEATTASRSIGRQMLGTVVWLNRMTWRTVALFIDVRGLVWLNRMTVLGQSFLLSIESSELVIYELYILMNKNK